MHCWAISFSFFQTSSVLHLDFLQQHVLQPEVNWAELVEAEEERREAKELKKQQKGSTPGESHSSEEMQSVGYGKEHLVGYPSCHR